MGNEHIKLRGGNPLSFLACHPQLSLLPVPSFTHNSYTTSFSLFLPLTVILFPSPSVSCFFTPVSCPSPLPKSSSLSLSLLLLSYIVSHLAYALGLPKCMYMSTYSEPYTGAELVMTLSR